MKKRTFLTGTISLLIMATILFAVGCPQKPVTPAETTAAETTAAETTAAETTAEEGKIQKVRLGTLPVQDDILPILWKMKGWDKEIGLDVELIYMKFWPEVQTALATGAYEMSLGIPVISMALQEKQPEGVLLGGLLTFDNGFALMIRPGEFKTLEQVAEELGVSKHSKEAVVATASQLKGKRIFAASNTDLEMVILDFIKKAGMKPSDITIIDMTDIDYISAFLGGEGDGAVVGIGDRYGLKKKGMVEMVTGYDMADAFFGVYLATTRDYYEKNTDVVIKVHYLWYKMVNWVNENLDEAAEIITKEIASRGQIVTVAEYKELWNNFEHFYPNIEAMRLTELNPESLFNQQRYNDAANDYYSRTGTFKEYIPLYKYAATAEFYNRYIQVYPVTVEEARDAREFYDKYVKKME